jgi:hypothetical protein
VSALRRVASGDARDPSFAGAVSRSVSFPGARLGVRACAAAVAVPLAACVAPAGGARDAGAPASRAASREAPAPLAPTEVAALLSALAADSMEGRATASPGAARAAALLAAELKRVGARPAGDDGFLQRVPLAQPATGGRRLVALPDFTAHDSIPAERRRTGANVVAVIPGRDPALRDEAVVVSAHYDHLGVREPVDGDSVFNGADDDASGCVAVLGVARALARGPAPRRTVVLLLATGEEMGLLGTRWYLDHPAVPLARTVANLNVEMIARPDSLAGGAGRAWLTGFELSTLGPQLRAAGMPLVPDPRPAQQFFWRSDNAAFVRRGIVAHTVSSYGMHGDYHTPRDEADGADPAHMAEVIRATTFAVRVLADGDRPAWGPAGTPVPPAPRARP